MKLHVHLSSDWILDTEMREYRPRETVDFCIVGTGAGGGVLAQRLARAGFSVVALEAGQWHDSERDMVSDEAGSARLYWNDLRITGGADPLELGANNSGKGVGGSTVHYAGFCPRLHPSDFHVRTRDGVAADWPISYEEIEPYYAQMEREYPVSGPARFPWGKPHGYPYAPLQAGTAGQMLIQGCTRLGIPVVAGGPVAIPAGRFGKRPHCIMRGFCLLGCKVGAKSSIHLSHIPDAIANGAEIRTGCMAREIPTDESGRATGVRYYRTLENGHVLEEEQRARAVIVAGYAIETPRLLLNSATAAFPDGLANSSGLLGRNLMTQSNQAVWGVLDQEVRSYKGPPSLAITEHWNYDDRKDFFGGYCYMSQGPLPQLWSNTQMSARGLWGERLIREMGKYNHQVGLKIVGEMLPQECNRVTLTDERDQYGLPVPRITYSWCDNDKRLIDHALRFMTQALQAIDAREIWTQDDDTCHLAGTARMGFDRESSVVDADCRSWDIRNLWICDGSVFPTGGGVNPSLTIQAIACRTGDRIKAMAARGEL